MQRFVAIPLFFLSKDLRYARETLRTPVIALLGPSGTKNEPGLCLPRLWFYSASYRRPYGPAMKCRLPGGAGLDSTVTRNVLLAMSVPSLTVTVILATPA